MLAPDGRPFLADYPYARDGLEIWEELKAGSHIFFLHPGFGSCCSSHDVPLPLLLPSSSFNPVSCDLCPHKRLCSPFCSPCVRRPTLASTWPSTTPRMMPCAVTPSCRPGGPRPRWAGRGGWDGWWLAAWWGGAGHTGGAGLRGGGRNQERWGVEPARTPALTLTLTFTDVPLVCAGQGAPRPHRAQRAERGGGVGLRRWAGATRL